MSLTPGWEEKDFESKTPGIQISFDVSRDENFYYLDNGSEFKRFPNTKAGWQDLCESLKSFEP